MISTDTDSALSSRDRTSAPPAASGPAPQPPDPAAPTACDVLLALLAGAIAFTVYVATMLPGVSAVGDATKFAFIGKVLGTPHAPGYPLYVVLSHLFSYVPWGTLAYRMNGFSALLGGVAVALNLLLMRRLGVGRVAAVSVALALSFGDAFWSRAQYAKYYTLNASLITCGMYALLRWGDTLRPRHLYATVAIFALASGNHLTIVGLVPALVLYSLLTSWRTVLRPAALVTMASIVLLGLSQYLFIWLRTVQGAPYLEARATSLSQLWAVMTARRFAHEIAAFSPAELWSMRIPLIRDLIERECGWLGLALVAAGAAVLFVRRPRQALLLVLGAAGIVVLTTNMASQEEQGFLLGSFVLLWPLAGVAIDWLASRPAGGVYRFAGRAASLIIAVALPASMVAANYGPNDRHRNRAHEDFIDAFLRAIPDRAAILDDEYRVNMLATYKLLGEGIGTSRGIGLVRPVVESLQSAQASGREVFALPTGRQQVLQYGARFEPFEFRVPSSAEELYHQWPVYRLLSVPTCLDVGKQGWKDISPALGPLGRLSVRIDNYRAFDSELIVWAGTSSESPVLVVGVSGRGTPLLSQHAYRRANPVEARALDARLAADGVTLPESLIRAPRLVRAHVRVNDQGDFSLFGLDFGGPVAGAMGRAEVDLANRKRATLCTHEFADTNAWPNPTVTCDITPLSSVVGFGDGWYDVERLGGHRRTFRWTARRASLIVPLAEGRLTTLTIEAEVFSYPGRRPGSVSVTVNGGLVGSLPTVGGFQPYTWVVPTGRWRAGLNEIVVVVDGATSPKSVGLSNDNRVLGLLVGRIRLAAPPGSMQPLGDPVARPRLE